MDSLEFSLKDEFIKKLWEKSGELFDIQAAIYLLQWDQETFMPIKGIIHRSRQLATLSTIYHEKLTSKEIGLAISRAEDRIGSKKCTDADRALVREMRRSFDKATKIPASLVRQMAEANSSGLETWKMARKEKKFSIFEKSLTKIFQLKVEQANFAGFKESAYDAMLDDYEPDLTTKQVEAVFTPLGTEVSSLLKRIIKSKKPPVNFFLEGQEFATDKTREVSEKVLEKIGYDFSAGRQDISSHPFTTNFGHQDVRLTNRFSKDNLSAAIFIAVHEGGHGLYELGISDNLANTILAAGTSLGIHESQSRMWENLIGRSQEFWEYWLPFLQGVFPKQLSRARVGDIYREVNSVSPGFIRVDADEVTYNLHIILRFEMEKAVMEGNLKVKDLPEAWNQKMKELLGIVPTNDSEGVLQDIHWSQGSIGYFPTYTLGNLYSAQFFQTMKKKIVNLEDHVSSGNFEPILTWLRKNIHQYGATYRADDLVKRVTGEELKPKYFSEYLENKYSKLYGI